MKNEDLDQKIEEFIAMIEAKNPHEPEFLQAVREVAITVIPFIVTKKEYLGMKLLERMAEPERTIIFRVPWVDDKGIIQVNRGFRIQMNSAIGPYKGGIRFHPTVNLSVLKFLAFEQVFKNSLTTLTRKENLTWKSCVFAKPS
jgi:glutamate dehydrogenase (NADP+)